MSEHVCCAPMSADHRAQRIRRREFLYGLAIATGGLALSAGGAEAQPVTGPPTRAAEQGGAVVVRWLGGGVVEVATPDYRQVAYVDAWVWSNGGWDRFGVAKPPEYASPGGLREYLAAKSPEAVLVLLSHDHGDHMGDYFELLATLGGAGLAVRTVGQSDLMRTGLVQRFRDAGLNPAEVVLNSGGKCSAAASGDAVLWSQPAASKGDGCWTSWWSRTRQPYEESRRRLCSRH